VIVAQCDTYVYKFVYVYMYIYIMYICVCIYENSYTYMCTYTHAYVYKSVPTYQNNFIAVVDVNQSNFSNASFKIDGYSIN
jgi:hypothetical protein